MGGVDLSDDGGLNPLGVPVLELEDLHGDGGVDDDFATKISEIDDVLCHAALLIAIDLLTRLWA